MASQKAFRTIWEYQVRDECISEFKEVYASDGDWVKLFSKSHGYIKTELIQDINDQNRFITIDYWDSHADFMEMKRNAESEYQDLDKKTDKFTLSENHLGFFEAV